MVYSKLDFILGKGEFFARAGAYMYISTGISTEKDPTLAVREAVRQANANFHGEKIDLVIAFATIDLVYPVLLKALNAAFLNRVPIVGCSGAAIIVNQGIFKHGLAVMLLGLPAGTYINTACVKDIKNKTSLQAGKELGIKLLDGFRDVRRVISVLFSDGLIDDGSDLLSGLQERLGKSFPLVGASASDNMRFSKTYVFFNQELANDCVAGVLWGGKVNFGLGVKHGWKPLGRPRTVTRAQGNIIYEIDDAPAASLYEEYLARSLTSLQRELKYISVLYPIGMYVEGEQEYVLRNILSIERDGSLHMQGNVATGSAIRLMIGTKESCLTATHQALEEAKNGLWGNASEHARASINHFVLVFDSVSRYMLLKRDAERELDIIKAGLGEETPIIGLYTFGEQAPLRSISYQGQAYFHNQTIAIAAIGG